MKTNTVKEFEEVKRVIQKNYGDYKWSNVKMENLCVEKPQEQESEKNNKTGGAATLLRIYSHTKFYSPLFHSISSYERYITLSFRWNW
jgi:hypothetical protein